MPNRKGTLILSWLYRNRLVLFILLMALVLIPPFLSWVRSVDTRVKIGRVKEDMRILADQMEIFYIKNTGYPIPDEAFVPGSVLAKRYGMDDETLTLLNQMDEPRQLTQEEEEIWNRMYRTKADYQWYQWNQLRRLRHFGLLTTPIRYLKSIPMDPFSRDRQSNYRYGDSSCPKTDRKYWLVENFLLISNGPDRDEDIASEYLIRESGQVGVYPTYPFQGTPAPIERRTYDPTNGLYSDGDIVRVVP